MSHIISSGRNYQTNNQLYDVINKQNVGGTRIYAFPPVTREDEIMVSFDDITTHLLFLKDEIRDLEHLVTTWMDEKTDGVTCSSK